MCRTLQIQEPVYFEAKPLCVFTEFYQEETVNETLFDSFYGRYKSFMGAPKHNRGTQAILKHLVNRYGSPIIQEAQKIAIDKRVERILERQLLNALYFNYEFKELSYLEIVQYLSKYAFRYFFFQEPFKELLSTIPNESSMGISTYD